VAEDERRAHQTVVGAGLELVEDGDVGVACPRPRHLEEHFARPRLGYVDVLDGGELLELGEEHGTHRRLL